MSSERLQRLDALVRELSLIEDPDHVVRAFSQESGVILPRDGLVSISRRNLVAPCYRITRSWRWTEIINPWTESERLPVFEHGLLGDLLYAAVPRIVNELTVALDDPAREQFEGMESLVCAPGYDEGEAVNMVILLRKEPNTFREEDLEQLLLNANLLGRAVNNLLLNRKLEDAYRELNYEKSQVGRMQKHLLPARLPEISNLDLGVGYFACSLAGGDYYDIISLPDEQCGLFIADVSGHGTPAAVVMAMIHTLMHAFPGPPMPPVRVLTHINRHLLGVAPEGMFATAFYGIYDPHYRRLRYASAGHPPPRLRKPNGTVHEVRSHPGLPLGVSDDESWTEQELLLQAGDAILLFTDGILDGNNPNGECFGKERLDKALRGADGNANAIVQHIEKTYRVFCGDGPEMDDYTLLAAVARS